MECRCVEAPMPLQRRRLASSSLESVSDSDGAAPGTVQKHGLCRRWLSIRSASSSGGVAHSRPARIRAAFRRSERRSRAAPLRALHRSATISGCRFRRNRLLPRCRRSSAVEQLIRNQQVLGSIPSAGSSLLSLIEQSCQRSETGEVELGNKRAGFRPWGMLCAGSPSGSGEVLDQHQLGGRIDHPLGPDQDQSGDRAKAPFVKKDRIGDALKSWEALKTSRE